MRTFHVVAKVSHLDNELKSLGIIHHVFNDGEGGFRIMFEMVSHSPTNALSVYNSLPKALHVESVTAVGA